VALQASLRTGAKFLGVVFSSHELPGIETGEHQPEELVLKEIEGRLREAKKTLGIKGAVIVNAHGGNSPLREKVEELGRMVGLDLVWNSTLVRGPHAGTEEFSMACALGMADSSRLSEHMDFERHPEVGFVGLPQALERYDWARKLAREVREKGVRADPELGRALLERAVDEVVRVSRRVQGRLASKRKLG
jgi:2-amino-5-formylamino-6-ribosylaminopyrimidin-4(3H)-one 5'-monophosphate deformylase